MPEPNKATSERGTEIPTTNDLLGFKRFTEPIASRVANSSDKGTPLTIGVYGEWGSGKTSFLMMVAEILRERDIYPIWFNAWKYDQEDNLWSALIQTILDQARISGKWYRRLWVKLRIWRDTIDLRAGSWEIARKLLSVGMRIGLVGLALLIVFGWSSSEISRFLNRVFVEWFAFDPVTLDFFQTSVIKAIVGIIAFFAAKPTELLKLFRANLGIDFSQFRRSTSYRARIAFLDDFSEEFRRIIKLTGNGKPLVVIIDDLDRCLPEKAVQVLEAIKLFLDVEGCIFLLAVDREVVETAIAVKYKALVDVANDPKGEPHKVFTLLGENYFEKIVQLPFALPPIPEQTFTEFVSEVYPDEHIRQCAGIFTAGSPRNPRKVKRLLHSFLFLRDLSPEEVENQPVRPSLIAKMVIVQNQFRSVYEDLARFPTLLEELERAYNDDAERGNTVTDPILREKVEAYKSQFPQLREVLLQKVDASDTFVGVKIEPYTSLATPVTEGKEEWATQESIEGAKKQYLQQIVSATQTIRLQAMNSSAVPSAQFDLGNLYIEMRLTDSGDGSGDTVSIMTDALKKTARLIILGTPGSGKSTLLAYLANTYASSALKNDASVVADRLGLSELLLPIFIPLREYGLYVEREDAQSSGVLSFLDFLALHSSQRDFLDLPPDFFSQHLERGSCILLLDGLDEVVDAMRRRFIVQTIEDLARRYSTARIIVTSRLASYHNVPFSTDFAHYEIAPLDQRAISEFVERRSVGLSEDLARASSLSKTFLATIREYPSLLGLAQNPLLLSTMFALFLQRRSLPPRRVDLFEGILELLLASWDTAKGIRSTEFTASEAKAILARLAYSAQESVRSGLEESFILSKFGDELERKGLPQSEVQSHAVSLLRAFRERAGILVEVGPAIFRFAHLIVQEYLVSIALAERNNYVELVLERHRDAAWQEIIVLSVARVARTTPEEAENVIETLLEAKTTDSFLLAGMCLVEIMPVENVALQNRTIEHLGALVTDAQVSDNVRKQGTEVLARLDQAV